MIAAWRTLAPDKIRGFTGYAARQLLCLAGLVVALALSTSSRTDYLLKKTVWEDHPGAPISGEGRKIYPLSVIYGGTYSAEELNRARRLDPVVRVHYADFGKNPVVQKTSKDLFMYVSYRRSDTVYWTKTKRRIPKGESVLSDSGNLARARCGNRLSFAPQQPTLPEKELPEEAFNTPEVPKISIPLDTPLPPATEADLYVPATPLPAALFSPMPPPPFAASNPVASSGSGGAYGPAGALGSGSPFGGAPFFGGGSGGFLSRNGPVGLGIPFVAPVGTPEPTTVKLLSVSALILALFYLGRKLHFRS